MHPSSHNGLEVLEWEVNRDIGNKSKIYIDAEANHIQNYTNNNKINSYGFNKLVAENYVKKYAKHHLIIRLPYVIGPNLKRNPFYDILHKKRSFLTLNSKVNCIHTDSIAWICMKLIKKNHEGIYNICLLYTSDAADE